MGRTPVSAASYRHCPGLHKQTFTFILVPGGRSQSADPWLHALHCVYKLPTAIGPQSPLAALCADVRAALVTREQGTSLMHLSRLLGQYPIGWDSQPFFSHVWPAL